MYIRSMDEARQQLLEAMSQSVDELAEEMVGRTRAEIPSFKRVPRPEHLNETAAFTLWLTRFSLGDDVPDLDRERLAGIGRLRAEQGVPVEDLLRAWRIAVEVGTDRAREIAAQLGLRPELLIELFQGTLRAADEALVPLAAGHRTGRPLVDVDPGRGRELFVLAVLTGELPVEDIPARAASYGLDPSAQYRALRAVGPESPERPPTLPTRRAADTDLPDPLTTVHEGELVGLVAGTLQPGTATLVALGPPRTLEELPASFAASGRVLNACRGLGLVGVYDLAGAALFVTASESGDAGDALVDRYLGPLEELPGGQELVATLRAWQGMGMRTEPAARRLHVHPNTLRYRLSRYGELTGVDLAETEEMVGLWLALTRAESGRRIEEAVTQPVGREDHEDEGTPAREQDRVGG